MHIQLYIIEIWLVQYPFQLRFTYFYRHFSKYAAISKYLFPRLGQIKDDLCILYNKIRMVRAQTILYGQLSLMEEKRQNFVKEMQ